MVVGVVGVPRGEKGHKAREPREFVQFQRAPNEPNRKRSQSPVGTQWLIQPSNTILTPKRWDERDQESERKQEWELFFDHVKKRTSSPLELKMNGICRVRNDFRHLEHCKSSRRGNWNSRVHKHREREKDGPSLSIMNLDHDRATLSCQFWSG